MLSQVPILKIEDYLLATVQATLSDEDIVNFGQKLLHAVGRQRMRAVIIDLSALDVIDSFATRQFRNMANATRLRGARTIMVGIQPDVAYGLVQLGMRLTGIETALDLEDALAVLKKGRRR